MMKRFLLLTICLAALSGSALAYDVNKGCCSTPAVDTSHGDDCSSAVKSLHQQHEAAVNLAEGMVDKCSQAWFAAEERLLSLHRQLRTAVRRSKNCQTSNKEPIIIATIEAGKRRCAAIAAQKKKEEQVAVNKPQAPSTSQDPRNIPTPQTQHGTPSSQYDKDDSKPHYNSNNNPKNVPTPQYDITEAFPRRIAREPLTPRARRELPRPLATGTPRSRVQPRPRQAPPILKRRTCAPRTRRRRVTGTAVVGSPPRPRIRTS
jgi:hypothetical protein